MRSCSLWLPLQAWVLTLQPALVICNQLPVPVQAALQPARGMARELRQAVSSQHSAAVLLHDPVTLHCVLVRPRGFTWSTALTVQERATGSSGGLAALGGGARAARGNGGSDSDSDSDSSGGDDTQGPRATRRWWSASQSMRIADHRFLVSAPGPGAATVALRLRVQRHVSGQIKIHVSSLLWMYNCTGLPVALRVCPTALAAAAGIGTGRGSLGHVRPVTAAHGTSPAVAAAAGPYSGGSGPAAAKAAAGADGQQQQQQQPVEAASDLWATPCVGPDGELLAVAAPRASHNAAVQVCHIHSLHAILVRGHMLFASSIP